MRSPKLLSKAGFVGLKTAEHAVVAEVPPIALLCFDGAVLLRLRYFESSMFD